MQSENQILSPERRTWISPEIFELDTINTNAGPISGVSENATFHGSSN